MHITIPHPTWCQMCLLQSVHAAMRMHEHKANGQCTSGSLATPSNGLTSQNMYPRQVCRMLYLSTYSMT